MALRQSPECRSVVQSQLKKTKLCRFFSKGKCRFGSDCDFAHGTQNLVNAPDLTKTSLCEDWLAGRCSITDGTCRYAHGEQELRMTPQYAQAALSRRATSGMAFMANSNGHATHSGDEELESKPHGSSTPEGESEWEKGSHDDSASPLGEQMSRGVDSLSFSAGVKLNQSLHGNCGTLTDAVLKPNWNPLVDAGHLALSPNMHCAKIPNLMEATSNCTTMWTDDCSLNGSCVDHLSWASPFPKLPFEVVRSAHSARVQLTSAFEVTAYLSL